MINQSIIKSCQFHLLKTSQALVPPFLLPSSLALSFASFQSIFYLMEGSFWNIHLIISPRAQKLFSGLAFFLRNKFKLLNLVPIYHFNIFPHRPCLLLPLQFMLQLECSTSDSLQMLYSLIMQPLHTLCPEPRTLLSPHIYHMVNSSSSFSTPAILPPRFTTSLHPAIGMP